MKYGFFASASLLSLFISMYCGLLLLAAKATEVFEGIPVPGTRERLLQVFAAAFFIFSVAFLTAVIRGLKQTNSQRPKRAAQNEIEFSAMPAPQNELVS